MLHASEVVVFDGRTEIARHARSVTKSSQTSVLDHYLEVQLRKPGALSGSTALAQARETGVFTMAHEAVWAAAKKAHGDADGTRALIDVLLLHRRLPAADVIAGISRATSADVVAVEARRARQVSQSVPSGDAAAGSSEQRRVVSLTERRLAALPTYSRPPEPLPEEVALDGFDDCQAPSARRRSPGHTNPPSSITTPPRAAPGASGCPTTGTGRPPHACCQR